MRLIFIAVSRCSPPVRRFVFIFFLLDFHVHFVWCLIGSYFLFCCFCFCCLGLIERSRRRRWLCCQSETTKRPVRVAPRLSHFTSLGHFIDTRAMWKTHLSLVCATRRLKAMKLEFVVRPDSVDILNTYIQFDWPEECERAREEREAERNFYEIIKLHLIKCHFSFRFCLFLWWSLVRSGSLSVWWMRKKEFCECTHSHRAPYGNLWS